MKNILSLLLMTMSIGGYASDPEDEVIDVVKLLFEGMRKGDSTIVRDVFTQDARLMTVMVKEGDPVLNTGSVDRFVKAVGSPHDKVWDEPIWDYEVQIDGNLAQVWTKYAFYLGDEFSHCGVDAFQLFKGKNGWRIFQLTDTRQSKNCDLPPGR